MSEDADRRVAECGRYFRLGQDQLLFLAVVLALLCIAKWIELVT
jgi:hypothetical protein